MQTRNDKSFSKRMQGRYSEKTVYEFIKLLQLSALLREKTPYHKKQTFSHLEFKQNNINMEHPRPLIFMDLSSAEADTKKLRSGRLQSSCT